MKRAAIFLTLLLPVSLLLGLGYVVNGRVQAKPQLVDVGGIMTSDTTWTAANSPYILTDTVTIPEGVTLTVEPGVTVLGQSYGGIVVEGTIIAIGTPTNPITFTSSTDSAPGQWPGFFFSDGVGHFEHVTIRYGGENVSDPVDGTPPSGANINVTNASDTSSGSDLIFRNAQIEGSNGFAISFPTNLLNRVELDNVTFTQNITNRIQLVTSAIFPISTTVTLSAQTGLDGYEFEGGLVIVDTGALVLEPGVTLFCAPEAGVIVQNGGHLTAVGTPQKPITFTTITDTAVGRWGGIFFWDGSAELVNTRIRFAGADVGQQAVSALHVYEVPNGQEAILENSVIEGSGGYAIAVEVDNLHQLHMQNNQFIQNAQNRILLLTSALFPISTTVTLSAQPGLDGYEFEGGLVIVDTGALTLEPGVTLFCAPEAGVIVQNGGHLTAVGTPQEPITFTTITDTAVGRWGGIFFWDGSAELVNTRIRFAGADVGQQAVSALHVYEVPNGQEAILENSVIEGSGGYAIAVEVDNLHQLHMQNNQFIQNAQNRILLLPDIDGGDGSLAGSANLPGQTGLESYELLSNIVVPTAMTLTVGAGATFMVPDAGNYLDVQGHLAAEGTAVNPILFTSIDDLATNSWLGINVSGSANFAHVTMRHAYTPLFIFGSSGGVVSLADSVVEENQVYPIVVNTDALHRLVMNNVTFSNNVPNRIGIDTAGGNLALAGSTTLGPQPGLEGYEELNVDVPTVFTVPEGITLTLQPGTNLMMLSTVQVAGHVAASGTLAEPVLWQTVPESDGGVFSVIVLPTGTAVFNHITLKGSPVLGLAVVGESDEPVVIENSVLEGMGEFPLLIEPASLHRLHMSNLTFLNNAVNRVLVDTSSGQDAMVADATLTAQPGLDWYEFADASTPQTPPAEFVVPEGVTLTIDSGVELRFGQGVERVVVSGRIEANGTELDPVIFDQDATSSEYYLHFTQTGSASLHHTTIKNATSRAIHIIGQSNEWVTLQNVLLMDTNGYPIVIEAPALHRLQMTNVTFLNNTFDRVGVDTTGGQNAIAANVTLTAQPGLEGYVFADDGYPQTPPAEFVVPEGITLTVEPGVELRFGDGAETMVVNGRLQAIGTPTQPITFTSMADSAPGQWEGVVVQNGSAQLEHTELRYGTYNLTVNNTAVSIPVTLQNSQLYAAAMDGLLVMDGAVTAVCSRFTNNNGSGVFVLNAGQPTVQISSSALAGNGDAGLTNQNPAPVDARQNWWGDASGPSGIGPGSGDAVIGNVLFSPWLEEDTCATVSYQLYLPFVVTP